MAWSFIQSVSAASIAGSQAVTFASNVTAGSKIIVAASVALDTTGTISISTVKDGASNSWTQIGAATYTDTTSGDQGQVSLWALDVPAGDAGTKPVITATASSSTSVAVAVLACEVSGLLPGSTTAMVDGTLASLNGSGGQTSTGSPAYSTGAASEFLVSVYGDFGNGTTWANPSGWTGATTGPGSSGTATGINDSADCDVELAYKNSTGSTETGSYAISGTSSGWALLTVAFKLPATATALRVPAAGALARSRPPARARVGNNLQPGDGYASPVVTPSGLLAPRRKVPQFPPKVTRARIGPRGGTGGGVASTSLTVQGVAGPPQPFVYRSPLPPHPAWARLGPQGTAAAGIASTNVTPYVPPTFGPTLYPLQQPAGVARQAPGPQRTGRAQGSRGGPWFATLSPAAPPQAQPGQTWLRRFTRHQLPMMPPPGLSGPPPAPLHQPVGQNVRASIRPYAKGRTGAASTLVPAPLAGVFLTYLT